MAATAAVVAAMALIAGCQVPQRQALLQPACLFFCQANNPVIDQGDSPAVNSDDDPRRQGRRLAVKGATP